MERTSEDTKLRRVGVSAEDPTFFYHSFPREPRQTDYDLGLNILGSILEIGLLLTAEMQTFPGGEGLGTGTFVQKRVCFTALTRARLVDHAKTFGSFSLEFDVPTIRSFGALPAVYLSGRLRNGELLDKAGEVLARHLLEAFRDLARLWELHERGNDAEKKLAKAVLEKIHPSGIEFQKLPFTLQALLNLYYPTDDTTRTGPLHYYSQREWKIIPNFAHNKTWHYKDLTAEQRRGLLLMNREFFEKALDGKPRVDYCSTFYDVGDKNIVDSVKRIIVPREVLDAARRLVADRGRDIEVLPTTAIC